MLTLEKAAPSLEDKAEIWGMSTVEQARTGEPKEIQTHKGSSGWQKPEDDCSRREHEAGL